MPTTCDIHFGNDDQTVYYGGQSLNGTVRLSLTKVKSVRGVFVRIQGEAYCHWTETESYRDSKGKNRTRTRSFTGRESYLNEKTYFVGGDNDRLDLAPGIYNHTFQCNLPHGLPTSVEGAYGHIRYSVEVVLDIPMWPDKEFSRSFTVIKMIDLNLDPMMREPGIHKDERTFLPCGFLCCWPSGPLKIEVLTPVKGYTPGQIINLKITAENESDTKVSSFTVDFVKNIKYFAQEDGSFSSRTKTEEMELMSRMTDHGCDRNQKKVFSVNLTVPSISPTDFTTSSVVKVKHYMKVTAGIDECCRCDEALYLPITIGTSPILDYGAPSNDAPPSFDTVISKQPSAPPKVPIAEFPPMPNSSASTEPFAPSAPGAWNVPNAPNGTSGPSAPSAPSLPTTQNPPTYEEAIGGAENKFKPKYPMYRRETSYSIDLDGNDSK